MKIVEFVPKDISTVENTKITVEYFMSTLNDYLNDHSVYNRATMRRASMDLTRQLAYLRKQSYN